MPRFLSILWGSLLLQSVLLAQTPNPGTPTWKTRQMTAVSEMGHADVNATSLAGSVAFEQSDDPTIAAHPITPHEPLPAARKMAEKAERLARKKQSQEAIAKYREAVALDPAYFQAGNNLALELDAAGMTEEAEQVFRRLMQSNPEHVLAFTNLATALSGRKRYVDAEVVARQALKLHKYSFKANFVLGTVLVDQGKWTDEAKDTLQYAQVKYPEAKALLGRWPDKASRD